MIRLRLTGREALALERCLSRYGAYMRINKKGDVRLSPQRTDVVKKQLLKQMMKSGMYKFQGRSDDEPLKVLAGTHEFVMSPLSFHHCNQIVNSFLFAGWDKRRVLRRLSAKLQHICSK